MNSKLIHKFLTLNQTERLQKRNHKFIPDYNQKSIVKNSNNKNLIPIFTPDFFKNKDVYINKHNRFADYPKHTHTFLEINYCLKGTAHEIVGNNSVTLSQGDILIIDVGTPHSIKALDNNDILINILLRNKVDYSIGKIIGTSKNANIHSKFLLSNDLFSKYLLYRSTQTEPQLQNLANLIIEEYFYPREFSNDLIKSYVDSFLILLSRNTTLYSEAMIGKNTSNLVSDMIKEITQNYQNISLNNLAKQTNYNRSYLGSTFKRETGISFSKALTNQRLLVAYNLINISNKSISTISHEVGISNLTFFYKKFQEKFGQTPNDIRKKDKQLHY